MKETWPEGIIVGEGRTLERHEVGYYWWWEKEKRSFEGIVLKSTDSDFEYGVVYQKAKQPPTPAPKRELELGWYRVDGWMLREKRESGGCYNGEGVLLHDYFDAAYDTYECITGFERVEKP